MSDDHKPRVVTGQFSKSEKESAAREQAMRAINEGWLAQLEFFALDARIARAKYLALVKEGFTEAQALQLCKP